MYGLDTIHKMNNESGKHVTGKAQTLAEIQEAAYDEAGRDEADRLFAEAEAYAKAKAEADRINNNVALDDWPEPRNDH